MQSMDAAAGRASALWLLVPGLGLISHTYAPFPPVMLFFLAALPLAWYGLDVHLHGGAAAASPLADARAWRPFLGVAAVYIGYMLVSQYMLKTSLRSTWGVVCSACYGVLPLLLWRNGPETAATLFDRHRPKFDWAFRIALVVYTFEALWRYGMVWLSSDAAIYQGIYRYKFGGLMYSESNATGIHILIWLFFTLWWARALYRRGLLPERRCRLRYIGMAVWWLALLGLTLSRACWLAAGIGLLYFCMPVSKLKYIWSGLLVCLVVAGAGFALFVYPHVQYDASFISKFQIWYAFLDYWQQASWVDKIFGIGLTRSEIAMGVYAHSYVLVFLVETGLVGGLLMLALFGRMLYDSRGEGLYILLPFALATLSTTVLFIPELFLFLSFMMAVRQSEKPGSKTANP